MEKGSSEFAEYWTSEFNELEHFKRHGKQMGFNKINDYSKAAKKFANSNERGTKSFRAKDRSIYKYNSRTNEFVIISKEGKIVTYFSPDTRYYFDDQWIEFGDYWIN